MRIYDCLYLLSQDWPKLWFDNFVLNEVYKVIPGLQSFHLTKAIAVRSIIDYAEYDATRLRQYQHPDIDRIMTGPWPKYRTPEREIRSQITNTFLSEGFNLKHDSNLLKIGEQWYRCRVNPGTIEAYLDEATSLSEKGLERSNVSAAIAPFNEATGYPRKWRK